jgi:signal recognition particle receptor subunit beta
MAQTNPERSAVNARIVYWGIDGAGKSTNLRSIHAKLRSDHRGTLKKLPTRLDPTVSYEVLPIELGEVAGVRTRLQIIAVPGAPEHAPTRKQLLDRVDGVVFVIDASPGRIDENIASFEELRSCLAAYGRSLEYVPLVIQHNKEDLADPYALEELHRKLDVRGAAVFVAVASEGSGVLQTLTTISKRVIRTLRETGESDPPRPEPPAAPPADAGLDLPSPPPLDSPAPTPPERQPLELEDAPLEPAVTQPTTLEDAALAAPEEEEEDEVATLAGRTEAVFEESWDLATEQAEATTRATALDSDWSLQAVGRATRAGSRSLRVPVVLSDGAGRELRIRLTVTLEPPEREEDD